MRVIKTIRGIGCLFTLLFALGGSGKAQVTDIYNRFEALDYKTFKVGTSRADRLAFKALRDEFVKTPHESTEFLVAKIEALIIEENVHQRAPAAKDNKDYMKAVTERRSPRLKGFIGLLLADLYPLLSPTEKLKVLTVLERSLTPEERHFHSNPIDWAFAKIGKDSVEAWLRLARHRDEAIRCHFATALSDLQAFTSVQSPKIDCHAQPATMEQQLKTYSRWWDSVRDATRWPVIPSIFDEIEGTTDRKQDRR